MRSQAFHTQIREQASKPASKPASTAVRQVPRTRYLIRRTAKTSAAARATDPQRGQIRLAVFKLVAVRRGDTLWGFGGVWLILFSLPATAPVSENVRNNNVPTRNIIRQPPCVRHLQNGCERRTRDASPEGCAVERFRTCALQLSFGRALSQSIRIWDGRSDVNEGKQSAHVSNQLAWNVPEATEAAIFADLVRSS